MELFVEVADYEDGVPCCSKSLLNQGKLLNRNPDSDHDFGFLDFDCKWYFTKGFEAPMGIINHSEIVLNHKDDKKWFTISKENHYFKNNQLHYPFCNNNTTFVVMSLKRALEGEDKDWDYFLWIVKYEQEKWNIIKIIEIEEWFRPLQFTQDESKLVVWGYLHLSIIDLTNFTVETLYVPESNNEYFTNAHLSVDSKYALIVILVNETKLQYTLVELSTGKSIRLSKGNNSVHDNFFNNFPNTLEFPVLVDRGRQIMKLKCK